jgi:hypothetical protein
MSEKYQLLDVKGDGSCFYRSIYNSAKHTNLLKRVVDQFSSIGGYEIEKQPSENEFVKLIRYTLSDMVKYSEDYGIIKDVHKYFKSLDRETYREVLNAFPDWFERAFRNFKDDESRKRFRNTFSDSIKKVNNWVTEIEIEIIKNVLMEAGIVVIVINNNVKRNFVFEPDTIYVLNIGEYHYNSILPKLERVTHVVKQMKSPNRITQKRITPSKSKRITPRKSPRKSKRITPRITPRKSKRITPRKSKKITPRKSPGKSPITTKQIIIVKKCVKGKIVNPATGYCVKIDGKIGRSLGRSLVTSLPKQSVKRACVKGKIVNPATGYCVKIDGKIGRSLKRS